jgi:hypothetical protein
MPALSCATTPRAAFLKLCAFRNKANRALSLWSACEIEGPTEPLVPGKQKMNQALF